MNLMNKNTQGFQNRIDNALIFKNQDEENLFETEKIFVAKNDDNEI